MLERTREAPAHRAVFIERDELGDDRLAHDGFDDAERIASSVEGHVAETITHLVKDGSIGGAGDARSAIAQPQTLRGPMPTR